MNNLVPFTNDRMAAEVSIRLTSEWEYEGEAKLREIEKYFIVEILAEIDAYSDQRTMTILSARTDGRPAVRVILESESISDKRKEEWKRLSLCALRKLVLTIGSHTETVFFSDGTCAEAGDSR